MAVTWETDLQDPDLRLEGRIWGYGPMQAEGRIAGRGFVFREEYERWNFKIFARDPIFPDYPYESDKGLIRSGTCDPSFRHPDAVELIRSFASVFLEMLEMDAA